MDFQNRLLLILQMKFWSFSWKAEILKSKNLQESTEPQNYEELQDLEGNTSMIGESNMGTSLHCKNRMELITKDWRCKLQREEYKSQGAEGTG